MFDFLKNLTGKQWYQPKSYTQPSSYNPTYQAPRPPVNTQLPANLPNVSYAPNVNRPPVNQSITPPVNQGLPINQVISPPVNTPPITLNEPTSIPSDVLSQNTTIQDVVDYRSQLAKIQEQYLANQASLMQTIQGLLSPSQEEQAASEALRNFDQSYRLGQQAISDKPIAMPFITGQQASLQRQAGIERQGLAEQYQALSGARTGQLGALKDIYGMQGQIGMDAFNMTARQQEFDAKQEQSQFERSLAERKFNEDVRQFGLQYAMQQQKMLADLQSITGGTQIDPVKQQEAMSNINLINQVLSNENLGSITGFLGGRLKLGNVFGNQEALNQVKQLKGILALGNREKLKGSGAVSDFEARTLERAASAIGRNLREGAFKKQLIQVRGAIATSHGQEAKIKITDPTTGKSSIGFSNSAGIAGAIERGLLVEYVQ